MRLFSQVFNLTTLFTFAADFNWFLTIFISKWCFLCWKSGCNSYWISYFLDHCHFFHHKTSALAISGIFGIILIQGFCFFFFASQVALRNEVIARSGLCCFYFRVVNLRLMFVFFFFFFFFSQPTFNFLFMIVLRICRKKYSQPRGT